MKKKRHHYVPKAYLRPFCDPAGKLRVYLKDRPDQVVHQAPDNTAFHKYYYSQPRPEGGMDDNTLEGLFSGLEAKWPPIVHRVRARQNVNDALEGIFNFIALQRVRVPASRDAAETMYAESAMATLRRLDAAGALSAKPPEYEELLDKVSVAVDPHQSIHAMVQMLRGAAQVLARIGLGALRNTTDLPFLTSDNPVIWFDPSVPDSELRPYTLKQHGPVALLFPIAPDLMIYGDSSRQAHFASEGFGYGDVSDTSSVEMMNRQICRFAYQAVFAQAPGQEALIRDFVETSPVLRTQLIPQPRGKLLVFQQVFGKRQPKPKWKRESSS
jgi:hypothetical protein